MEELGPELKAELVPRLKGKPQERQRQWIQVGGLGSGVGVGGPRLPGTPRPRGRKDVVDTRGGPGLVFGWRQ